MRQLADYILVTSDFDQHVDIFESLHCHQSFGCLSVSVEQRLIIGGCWSPRLPHYGNEMAEELLQARVQKVWLLLFQEKIVIANRVRIIIYLPVLVYL